MQRNEGEGREVEINVPLLLEQEASLLPVTYLQPKPVDDYSNQNQNEEDGLGKRVWIESRKLWHIAGPAMFSRVTSYTTVIISQVFAGRLGELQLASFSIAYTVFIGISFGILLGMASALETLCGQAYGAKKYQLMGIYMQRSWIVLFLTAILILPIYIYTTPILKLIGQPDDLSEQTGLVTFWLIPTHFALPFYFGLQRFLQSQLKMAVTAWASFARLVFHVFVTWYFVYRLGFGIIGIAVTLNLSWWVLTLGLLGYVIFGGCPNTWTGLSTQAFSGLWEFFKLSAASGVMLCLETWYYRILVLMTAKLNNAKIAVDALSVCMSINTWEFKIPLSFFTATGVRVSNELGAGNGKGTKFASIVSATTSLVIGLLFCSAIMIFHEKIATVFTSSDAVLKAVDNLVVLLGMTVLLNSIQPVLSVAYINIGSYYIVGLPLGVVLGLVFHLGISGIWSGMIAGTAVQTLILIVLTIRCDWDMQEKFKLRLLR
ncbi:hypothetical protein MKW94_029567 [Papaver nudicaule]|uniref:Protein DETOXIFICATION n=2 Tax=Papaver nudicaule TaxID=74823 RepID=A0AA41VM31_PAPNU|nr:hypothetical protein [Papaver nudicaule]